MKRTRSFEFPKSLDTEYRKAKKIEWISIVFLASTSIIIFLVMGESQTMKTAWVEDLLSLVPAISFLIATKIVTKSPNDKFPYGYHKATSIAFLVSALALFAIGSLLFIDAIIVLIKHEHPTIGMVVIFGHPVWLGYLMIGALIYSTVPPIFLGRIKLPLAEKLHEKNLYTDAKINKADWMTAIASVFGIIGIGLGWWWADSVAAAMVSFDIIVDGYINLKESVFDILDQAPKTIDDQQRSPIPDKVKAILDKEDWIIESEVRLREDGHVFFGEGFVVPRDTNGLMANQKKTLKKIYNLDWKIQDFHLSIVDRLSDNNSK